jgi:hypothetical protein
MIDGATNRSLHWNPNGMHGAALLGNIRDRVVRFAGTGSTRKSVNNAEA